MNKRIIRIVIPGLAWGAAMLTTGAAQDASAPSVVVAKVPENIRWRVTWQSLPRETGGSQAGAETVPGSQPGSIRLESVVSEHGAGIRKITFAYSDGTERSHYLTREFRISESPRGKISVSLGSENTMSDAPSPLAASSASQFNEFNWIKEADFRGVVVFRGKRCNKYEETETTGTKAAPGAKSESSPARPQPAIVRRTAYIDATTKLPVALQDPTNLYLYEFQPIDRPPVLPAGHLSALEGVERKLERARNRYKIPQ